MQMLRRSKSPSKAASSSSSAWSAAGGSAVASSSSAAAGPSSYSSSSSRPASPSKPPPSSWRPPSVAGSQIASGIHFDDEVYVDGEGSVAAEARLPGRVAADGVTRADFFDVVLDDEQAGQQQQSDALFHWLGSLVTDQAGPSSQTLDDDDMDNDVGMPRTGSSGSINAIQQRSKTTSNVSASQGNPARYESMLMELVETERSYVRRLDTLYNRYAKPLRQAARGREGAILPLYEAQRLFGNVGELLGANMAFLQDLEECLRGGGWEALKGSVGDIAHRNIACFTCYNEYLSNFEKAKHIEQTQTRTNRLFRDFSDQVKHASSTQMGNVSIRELIMEPVQRIPRYKLLLDGMIKALPAEYAGQRAKLEASVLLCSRIASCEVDEKTQRAAVLWSFARNVQGFPAGLFSVHRSFIDAIDVEDFPLDGGAQVGTPSSLFSPSVGGTAARSVPCTLFLFDDAVLIAKRNSAGSSGKRALRLHDLNRLADEMKTYTEKSGTPSQPAKRAELSFRGVSDILDIQACDLGGPDLQLTFRRSPSHIHHEKWTGRPLRQYATVPDPHAAPDSPPPRFDKMRFLENLWRAQALFKARREGNSHVRSAVMPARSEDAEPRRVVYWNVYPRGAYQVEQNKASVAVVCGQALQLGAGAPHAVLRIHSIDEEYGECVYSTRDDDDEYVLPLSDLAQRVRKLQESLRLSPDIAPSTPSAAASHRGRVAAGLESFGRSLFSGTPESIRFGSPRRKGSILSRSSVATGSDVFSQSGRSVSTAGTSVNSRDMLASGTAVDAAGKLLPPGSPKASTRVGRHSRTTSAGTVDMLLGGRGVREEARPRPVSVAAWEPPSEPLSPPPSSVLRQRLASPPPNDSSAPSSPPLTRIMANKPSGPRAAPSPAGTPKRKPVPVTDVPYTPTRRVPSTASKRAAPRESDREEEGEQLGGSIKRSKAESVAATTPLGPRTRASPTPKKANASTSSTSSSSSSSLRGRLHRHLARLDESDKENAAHLVTLGEEAEELRGVASQLSSRTLDELVDRVETWIEESEGRGGEMRGLIGKVAGDVEMLLARVEEKERERDGEEGKAAAAAKSEAEARVLRTRCEALQRKCELLTALEKDGRLENAALHTAFNEELDRLYDDAQLTSRDAEVAALREEVKRTKAQRNEARARCGELEKEGKLQKSKLEAWEGVLRGNGLL